MVQPRRGLRYKNKPKPGAAAKGGRAAGHPPPAPTAYQQQQQYQHLVAAAMGAGLVQQQQQQQQQAHSSDASEGRAAAATGQRGSGGGSDDGGDDPAALFRQRSGVQLPLAAPLQQQQLLQMHDLPFGLAFGGLDPAAAAAAAAHAFKNAPRMFSSHPASAPPVMMPWGYAPQQQPCAHALFQPPVTTVAAAAEPAAADGVKPEAIELPQQQQQADAAFSVVAV